MLFIVGIILLMIGTLGFCLTAMLYAFASKKASRLHAKLVWQAQDNPRLRADLLPILQQGPVVKTKAHAYLGFICVILVGLGSLSIVAYFVSLLVLPGG